jgi:hypothetical protein
MILGFCGFGFMASSVVWDEQFSSDEEAYAEFNRTVADEGMQTFLDQGNVIPFRR